MFTFEQIKELVELVAHHRLHGLEIERSGFHLKITGEPAVPESALPAPANAPAAPTVVATASSQPPPASAATPGLHVVVSPIVGTFYTAPSPDSPPFVRIGDRVRKGQVLCIVEAMKLMNEIESDADGVIAEIHPRNAQPIEYGEPLFGIRPD